MEAKDSIVKLIKALLEIDMPTPRQLLIDHLMGRRSRQIEELGLPEKETFGIGETYDDDFWMSLIDAAYEGGLLKQTTAKTGELMPTPAGKKFARKPTSFELPDDENLGENVSEEKEIDSLLEQTREERPAANQTASPHAKQQIKLITAIDRHIALEDFAESEGLSFDEVLDELEEMAQQKHRLDISYFTDEVLGQECMQELMAYFKHSSDDSLDTALEEYSDVYKPEELRLARIVYRMNKIK